MRNRTRRSVTAAGFAALFGVALAGGVATPAHAGGPGTHYVFGATAGKCSTNLNNTIKLYRANDYVVTGIHGCRLAGDRKRYFADFVAYPE